MGPAIFANFNKQMVDGRMWKISNIITKKSSLKNVTAESGKPLRVSDNGYMFKDVTINR